MPQAPAAIDRLPGPHRQHPRRFHVLDGLAREIWIVLAVELLGGVSGGITNKTLALWLSSDLGYDDAHAGYWAAAASTATTLAAVVVGSLGDALGLRKAFLLGGAVCVAARFVVAASTRPWLALGFGLAPLSLGQALGATVLVAATRRYSTTAQRSIAFSIAYAAMNAGLYVAAIVFDALRAHLGEHGHLTLPGTAFQLGTYRALLLVAFAFEVIQLPLLFFGIREGAEATPGAGCDSARTPVEGPAGAHARCLRAGGHAILGTLGDAVRISAGLWRQPACRRLLGFFALVALVRLVFVQLDHLYPKFAIRELGQGAPVAALTGVNALLIIVLVPLVGVLSRRVPAYRMVLVGSAIAAASLYIVSLPPRWFAAMADGWLGHVVAGGYLRVGGEVSPWYVSIFLFIVVLSIGESIYSPRVYEHAAAIAPRGREGSYAALSSLPFAVAKLGAASSSGVLLQRYCPEVGERHSGTLWLILAVTASIAPIGLFALRRRLRVGDAGRENGA